MTEVGSLLAALARAGVDLPEREAAEALWLAVHMQATIAPATTPGRAGPASLPQAAHDAPTSVSASDGTATSESSHADAPGVPILHRSAKSKTHADHDVLPVRLSLPRELRQRLELQRALRPLKRTVPSRTAAVLDEQASAERSADAGSITASFIPSGERWLSLALVVDASPSMILWGGLAGELQELLAQIGIFRAIRTWQLRHDGTSPVIAPLNRAGVPRTPRELIDPTGRQAILVLTDCVDAAWQSSGTAMRTVASWARTGPVAIVQPLSQELWTRCAVDCLHVQLRAPEAGVPNNRLMVGWTDLPFAGERPGGIPVPVLEIGPDWLAAWARLVAGQADPAHLMAAFTGEPAAREAITTVAAPEGPAETDPVHIVERFMAGASADAFRLAGFLAAAPLNLPTMRRIQQVMLPDSRPQQLAEVYLGGLLRLATPAGPDAQYEFRPGVREVLLNSIRRSEAIKVTELVSAELSRSYGTGEGGFTVFVNAGAGTNGRSLGAHESYSQIEAQLLRRIGGHYAEAAGTAATATIPEPESKPTAEATAPRRQPIQFDEKRYVEFLREHRRNRTNPVHLMERYAITLPASDADIKAQVAAVRAYWHKTSLGNAGISRIAKWCQVKDEELRNQPGVDLESAKWWKDAQDAAAHKSARAIKELADLLKQAYGELGVVTALAVGKAASRAGLSAAEAAQAALQAGLAVIDDTVTLPEAAPLAPTALGELARNLRDCHVATIPELLHPGSGTFRIVTQYECVGDPSRRLDLAAIESQRTEAGKSLNAINTTKLNALNMLRDAQIGGIDLRVVTLSHLMLVVEDDPPIVAMRDLERHGVDARDAATIAALLEGRQKATRESASDKIQALLVNGELREAANIAASLSGDEATEARQKVAARERELASLLAQAETAQQSGNEPLAEQLLRDAARISRREAGLKLAQLPPPPAGQLRATGDGAQVRLFWERGPGHDAGTVYAVTRTTGRPPAAPADGTPVHRGPQTECADPGSPVATEVQYGVFALADGRPPSRAVTTVVTALPPVWDLKPETGIGTVTLSWHAREEAEVRVTRATPGAALTPVVVTGSSVRLTGLPDGVAQRFEVIAVYRDPGGAELRSRPQSVVATPRGEAKPNATLRVVTTMVAEQIQVQASWKRIDSSRVTILRSDGAPPWPEGEIITLEQAGRAGTIVAGHVEEAGTDCRIDFVLPDGIHYLTALSEGGTGIAVGKTRSVAIVTPVTELAATAFADYATVSWLWPASVQLAEVSWQLGDDDRSAGHVQLSRAEYQATGGTRVPLGTQPCRVEVRALVTAEGRQYSSPPASIMIDRVMEMPIRYQVSGGTFRGRSRRVVFSSDQACTGIQVRMVAFPGRVMPTKASDGIAVLEATLDLRPGIPAEHKVELPKPLKPPYWVRCFVLEGDARLIDPPIESLKEE